MRPITLTLLAALCLAAGAQGQDKDAKKHKAPVVPRPPALRDLDGRTFVLVANGSGDSTAASDGLVSVVAEMRAPFVVIPVPWCRFGNAAKDYADHEAQLAGAAAMAGWVDKLRKECPRSPIFIVGHSSGGRVAVAAAEMCPRRSVERVYLLAPSISCAYDLLPAMKATRSGVHNFFSEFDTVLQIAADHWGSADGQPTRCAGEVGFRVSKEAREKHPELNRLLVQVRWRDELGGCGGHYVWVHEGFIQRFLLPSMFIVEEPAAK